MRIKRGSILITLGLLMLASAGGRTAYNLYDEYKAGEQAQQALEVFDFLQEQADEEPEYAIERDVPVTGPGSQRTLQPSASVEQQVINPTIDAPDRSIRDLPEQTPDTAAQDSVVQTATPQDFAVQGETFACPSQESKINTVQPAVSAQADNPVIYFPAINYDEVEIPDYILNPDMDMPVKEKDGQKYIGVLEIPVLNLTLPVISEWNYARLKKAPCRYVGSAYTDDLVIAAHNYKTHFGRLKTLKEGDRVNFTDAVGNRFEYEVVLTETLMPNDVREMKSAEFDLSLFTCTVGGSYRVTVRCDRL